MHNVATKVINIIFYKKLDFLVIMRNCSKKERMRGGFFINVLSFLWGTGDDRGDENIKSWKFGSKLMQCCSFWKSDT